MAWQDDFVCAQKMDQRQWPSTVCEAFVATPSLFKNREEYREQRGWHHRAARSPTPGTVQNMYPVKRHRGSRDTHGTHGTHGRTRANGSHGRTSQSVPVRFIGDHSRVPRGDSHTFLWEHKVSFLGAPQRYRYSTVHCVQRVSRIDTQGTDQPLPHETLPRSGQLLYEDYSYCDFVFYRGRLAEI